MRIYIYIYIYTHTGFRNGKAAAWVFRSPTGNPRTKNLNFTGFDSGRFLILRGGIPRSAANSPEVQTQRVLGYGFCGKADVFVLWVSCCLARSTRTSPEFHRNFARISTRSTFKKGITATQPSHRELLAYADWPHPPRNGRPTTEPIMSCDIHTRTPATKRVLQISYRTLSLYEMFRKTSWAWV